MKTLRLENINLTASYRVGQTDNQSLKFYFDTDAGLRYNISFMEEHSFISEGAYQFCVNVEGNGRSYGDSKLRSTIISIIEEFFRCNGNEVMLYLCETGDGKQKFRNRLFIQWFNNYKYRDLFLIRTAEGKMEGQDNFTALFIKKDNPHLQAIIEEFDEITSILFD